MPGHLRGWWCAAACVGALAGCGGSSGPGTPPIDGGPDDAGEVDAGPERLDSDNDGLPDAIERPGGVDVDTDGDGTPDHLDIDADGDTVLDRHEGDLDFDADGIPNFRDLDSDGDGRGDAEEAGDTDPETPPVACGAEIDARWRPDRDGVPPPLLSDGLADFADVDSDNDGLGDGEEAGAVASDPCDWDTDDDELGDLVEAAYARINCDADPTTCRCATEAACTIPATDFFVILPYQAEAIVRPLDFSTAIDAADVVFLVDTSRGNEAILDGLREELDEIVEGLRAEIGELRVGAVTYEDLPFGGFGGGLGCGGDVPFRLLSALVPGDALGPLRDALAPARVGCGGDDADAHALALELLFTGGGQTFTSGSASVTVPAHGENCEAGLRGAVCFRPDALPLVLHAVASCAHGEPPGGAPGCSPYTGVTPSPPDWETALGVTRGAGARVVGLNTSTVDCRPADAPDRTGCHFLRQTARETGTVEVDEGPVVLDLPPSLGGEALAAGIVDVVTRVVTRVPYDVDTSLRDDPADPEGVDARAFVLERRPSCRWDRLGGPPPDAPCWAAAPGFTLEETLSAVDDSTFFDVLPRSRVSFDIRFANDFVEPVRESKVFAAFLDLRSDGGQVVDTRQVYVLVPAGEPPDPG